LFVFKGYDIETNISNIIEKTHYYSLNVSASLPHGVFFLSLAVETSCWWGGGTGKVFWFYFQPDIYCSNWLLVIPATL